MDPFIRYILQFGNLNDQQMDLVKSKATAIELRKDEFYWEAGKAVRQVGFITDGVLRVYYYNNKGDEITRYFIDDSHLILPGNTGDEFYIPSEYVQAITDCKMVVFSKQDWIDISETIIGWDLIIQKIMARHHTEKLKRRSDLVAQDATARYLGFIEKFPALANRIPLAYIASYLGMTASSLSRVRKNIR